MSDRVYHILDLADADLWISLIFSVRWLLLSQSLSSFFPIEQLFFLNGILVKKIVFSARNQQNLMKLSFGRLSQVRLITIIRIKRVVQILDIGCGPSEGLSKMVFGRSG